jgi:hypothetical protein
MIGINRIGFIIVDLQDAAGVVVYCQYLALCIPFLHQRLMASNRS